MTSRRPLDWATVAAAVLALVITLWQASNSTVGRISALEQSETDKANEIHEIHVELQELRQWALGHK